MEREIKEMSQFINGTYDDANDAKSSELNQR